VIVATMTLLRVAFQTPSTPKKKAIVSSEK
jgi:hypothetical protein